MPSNHMRHRRLHPEPGQHRARTHHTHIHTPTHTYTCMHMHTHAYTCIHINAHTPTYLHTHTHTMHRNYMRHCCLHPETGQHRCLGRHRPNAGHLPGQHVVFGLTTSSSWSWHHATVGLDSNAVPVFVSRVGVGHHQHSASGGLARSH